MEPARDPHGAAPNNLREGGVFWCENLCRLTPPPAGRRWLFRVRPQYFIKFDFDLSCMQAGRRGEDMVLSFANGSEVVFEGFVSLAERAPALYVVLPDGNLLAGETVAGRLRDLTGRPPALRTERPGAAGESVPIGGSIKVSTEAPAGGPIANSEPEGPGDTPSDLPSATRRPAAVDRGAIRLDTAAVSPGDAARPFAQAVAERLAAPGFLGAEPGIGEDLRFLAEQGLESLLPPELLAPRATPGFDVPMPAPKISPPEVRPTDQEPPASLGAPSDSSEAVSADALAGGEPLPSDQAGRRCPVEAEMLLEPDPVPEQSPAPHSDTLPEPIKDDATAFTDALASLHLPQSGERADPAVLVEAAEIVAAFGSLAQADGETGLRSQLRRLAEVGDAPEPVGPSPDRGGEAEPDVAPTEVSSQPDAGPRDEPQPTAVRAVPWASEPEGLERFAERLGQDLPNRDLSRLLEEPQPALPSFLTEPVETEHPTDEAAVPGGGAR